MSEIIADFEYRAAADSAADAIRRLFPKLKLAVVDLATYPNEPQEAGRWAIEIEDNRAAADYLHFLFNWYA